LKKARLRHAFPPLSDGQSSPCRIKQGNWEDHFRMLEPSKPPGSLGKSRRWKLSSYGYIPLLPTHKASEARGFLFSPD
jgi:hypothetical protein